MRAPTSPSANHRLSKTHFTALGQGCPAGRGHHSPHPLWKSGSDFSNLLSGHRPFPVKNSAVESAARQRAKCVYMSRSFYILGLHQLATPRLHPQSVHPWGCERRRPEVLDQVRERSTSRALPTSWVRPQQASTTCTLTHYIPVFLFAHLRLASRPVPGQSLSHCGCFWLELDPA